MSESRSLLVWTIIAVLLLGVALAVRNPAFTIAAIVVAFVAVSK